MRNCLALPIGANVVVYFNDDEGSYLDRYVSFGKETFDNPDGDPIGDDYGVPDDQIFYYVDGIEEWTSIIRNGHEEWTIVSWDFIYQSPDEEKEF